MRIRLLQDVEEDGKVKTTIRPRRKVCIAWFQGTEIEVSEVTGQILIDEGKAELVVPVEAPAAEEGSP